MLSLAVTAEADQAREYEFDIPRQGVETALSTLATQTGALLLFPYDLVQPVDSKPVSGRYSVEDALAILLQGTGLTGGLTEGGVITISRAGEIGSQGGMTMVQDHNQSNGSRATTKRRGLLGMLAAVFSAGVGAQEAVDIDEGEMEIDEIVVTGTNIRGIEDGPSPVIVLDREAIEATGLSTVEDLVATIPQNFGGGPNNEIFGTTRNGATNSNVGSGINLRGLGPSSTLVLLNGRRLSTSGRGTFVDISLIPVSAIERIEILTDGASAVYGADAVAGVVNVITKNPFDGGQTSFRVGNVTTGERTEYQAAQTIGTKWSSGGIIAGYEYRSQNRLSANSRDFVDLPENNDLFPESERHSAYFNLTQELLTGIEASTDVIYSKRKFSRKQDVFAPFDSSGTDQSIVVGGSIEADLGTEWGLRIDGTYSHADLESSSISIDGTQPDIQILRDSSLRSVSAILDGPLVSLPAGDIRFAMGAGYRDEELLGSVDTELSRNLFAVFGEVAIPVFSSENEQVFAKQLDLSASIRSEEYSDFGSTTNYKVGLVWAPIKDLTLRSTFGTSFRAPALDQAREHPSPQNFLFAAPDPSSETGSTLAILITGGFNPELQPEEAETFAAGFDYTPSLVQNARFSLNYFDVEYDGRITDLGSQLLDILPNPDIFSSIISRPPSIDAVNTLVSGPGFINLFGPFTPADIEAIVDARVTNVGVTKMNGLDFEASYSRDISEGSLILVLNGSYFFNFDQQLTSTAAANDIVDTIYNPVDFRLRSGASWSIDGLSLNGYINYVDGYRNNLTDPESNVDPWITVDLRVACNFGSRDDSILNDVTLALSVRNLFDQDPPDIGEPLGDPLFAGQGYDPENATALGRFIAFQITKDW